jgi:hypothetical protein
MMTWLRRLRWPWCRCGAPAGISPLGFPKLGGRWRVHGEVYVLTSVSYDLEQGISLHYVPESWRWPWHR